MKKLLLFIFAVLMVNTIFSQVVFINELHYDNTGGDTGEGVEVAGPAGTNLMNWSIVLYNGNGGASYSTINLSGTIPDEAAGFGALAFFQPGIQNGNPDGLALVDAGGNVIQFLSYGGSFTAVNGPANGMTSTDIGVSEPSSTPIGQSLQLGGMGSEYPDFTWNSPATSSFGSINAGQTFLAPAPVTLSQFTAKLQNQAVQLNWTTASETNNDGFMVEHSSNGVDFSAIEQIKGAGTDFAANSYEYLHESPVKGRNYYRLAQVDFDGKITYSPVKTVLIEHANTFKVYPTLAKDAIYLSFGETNSNNATVEVFDLLGHLVIQKTITGNETTWTLDIADLQNGTYLVRMQAAGIVDTARFIKD